MTPAPAPEQRWQLYRLLGEPARLRLLALAGAEELGVGELAELLGESQPNVSRHAAALRQAGLLDSRRAGTRAWVRLAPAGAGDPVVADALRAGQRLCQQDGSLARVPEVVARRDHAAREYFARPGTPSDARALSPALPAYLFAVGEALRSVPSRGLAIDVGTGEGALLDVLAPLFERVVATDRSASQLARARARVGARLYQNVSFVECELGLDGTPHTVAGPADLVVSSRVLHHAPRPREWVRALAALAAPQGLVLIIDYGSHDDESLAREQADVWLGFSEGELLDLALAAGLTDARVVPLCAGHLGTGRDVHLPWQALLARRPKK